MDDWVILAPTRWKLRRAIKTVKQTLNELKVEEHPDKTFIGRIKRGFDFLGYRFSPQGLSIAPPNHRTFQSASGPALRAGGGPGPPWALRAPLVALGQRWRDPDRLDGATGGC